MVPSLRYCVHKSIQSSSVTILYVPQSRPLGKNSDFIDSGLVICKSLPSEAQGQGQSETRLGLTPSFLILKLAVIVTVTTFFRNFYPAGLQYLVVTLGSCERATVVRQVKEVVNDAVEDEISRYRIIMHHVSCIGLYIIPGRITPAFVPLEIGRLSERNTRHYRD